MGTGLGAVRRLSIGVRSVFAAGAGHRGHGAASARARSPHLGRRQHCRSRARSNAATAGGWPAVRGATALLVVDGLGHGTFAAQAAQAALAAFDRVAVRSAAAHHGAPAPRTCAARAARRPPVRASTRRAPVVRGCWQHSRCAAVGADGSCGLVSHNGTLGVRVARMHQFEYQRPKGALLLMNSDGVSARWNLAARPGLLQRHPAVVAGVLYRDHARGHDDATLVALALMADLSRQRWPSARRISRLCAPSSRRPTAAWWRCMRNWMTRRSSCARRWSSRAASSRT